MADSANPAKEGGLSRALERIDKRLSRDLRALRQARSLTLAQIAERIGRSVGWMSQVERGISMPTLADLRRLADQFGVPITSFAQYQAFVAGQSTSSLYPQQDLDALTAELRLSSSGHGPLNWTVGGFYSKRTTDVANPQLNVNPGSGYVIPSQIDTIRFIHDELKQVAAFGELSLDITTRLNVTGALPAAVIQTRSAQWNAHASPPSAKRRGKAAAISARLTTTSALAVAGTGADGATW